MRAVHGAVVIVAGFLAACSADPPPTGPSAPESRPSFAISDAAHNQGLAHFFFTAPLVPDPQPTGPFDPTADPVIEVCEWTGTACGALVARFTRSGGTGGESVKVDRRSERYFANWNTSQCMSGSCALDPSKTYRIRVLIGGLEAGFADLDVVATKAELKNVNTAEYVPLLNGKPLKIAFRIEQGLTFQPGSITGTIVAATRGPLSGITVVVQPAGVRALTDQNGAYTASPVPPGTVTVSLGAVPSGCTLPQSQTTALQPGGSAQVDFAVVCTLPPAAPVRLEVGVDYSCILRGGMTQCWGSNQFGKLGDGTEVVSRSTPGVVLGGLTFETLAVGYHHACGLTLAGAAYCWGLNGSGTLGDGTTESRPTPVPVAGGLAFKQLSANESNTCGISTSGIAYCWGGNLFGQLGVPSAGQSETPIAVSTTLTFHSITAGGGHTCALTEFGAAYCWGQNASGQLGDGTTTQRFAPVPVQGGLTFAELTAGDLHTCGRTPAGKAYCWGLGPLLGSGRPPVNHELPVEVLGDLSFRSLAAGANHTCGITQGGAAYCWGFNLYGQLGQAGDDAQVPIEVSGGLLFEQLAGGGRHTCGLTASGDAYCWGDNEFGELGNGAPSQTPSPTPVQVLFGG